MVVARLLTDILLGASRTSATPCSRRMATDLQPWETS